MFLKGRMEKPFNNHNDKGNMSRGGTEPYCYPTSEREFVGKLHVTGKSSLYVTIPRVLVRDLGLRPGSTVKIYLKEVLRAEDLNSDRPE